MVIRFSNFRARFYYIGMVMRTPAFLILFWAAATAPPAPTAGESKVNPADGQPYVRIPPGTFRMGCSPGDNECYDNEKPAHRVTISKGFWMGQTEVTVGAYKGFVSRGGGTMPSGNGSDGEPVVNVTWNDAVAYCRWAGGRLPTEAEWEYAARAGTTTATYGGDLDPSRLECEAPNPALDPVAWFCGNSTATQGAGSRDPNAWGLYDMLGNAWEWCNDSSNGLDYPAGYAENPWGSASAPSRILRGGSCFNFAADVRAARRFVYGPGDRYDRIGFRPVRTMP